MAKRAFIIWTAEQRLRVEARSLARAVAQSGVNEKKEPILLIAEEKCVAQSAPEHAPFVLAVVQNEKYQPPEDGN
jgi:hypothetical protein